MDRGLLYQLQNMGYDPSSWEVDDAELDLYCALNYQSASANWENLNICRVTGSWGPSSLDGCDAVPSETYCELETFWSASDCPAGNWIGPFDVTDVVYDWFNNGVMDEGFDVRDSSTTNPDTWWLAVGTEQAASYQQPKLTIELDPTTECSSGACCDSNECSASSTSRHRRQLHFDIELTRSRALDEPQPCLHLRKRHVSRRRCLRDLSNSVLQRLIIELHRLSSD